MTTSFPKNVSIPIYRTANPKAADGVEFKVAYYAHEDGQNKRRAKTFSDGAKAEKFAQTEKRLVELK